MRVKICDGLLTYCLRLFVGSLKMKMEMSKLQVFFFFWDESLIFEFLSYFHSLFLSFIVFQNLSSSSFIIKIDRAIVV